MKNLSDSLKNLVARIVARSENFVSGRHWSVEVVFLAVLFSVLFSGGVDDWLWKIGERYPSLYYSKIEHPLMDVSRVAMADTHDAKINFRLTVPVILHLLHIPAEEYWLLPVLTACGTCAILWISCWFTFRVTADRVCALFVTLAISSTYMGSLAFTRYYDAIAICQLLLAMLPGVPNVLRTILVFTAAFTDERAFIAAPLLLVQNILPHPDAPDVRPRLLNRGTSAILIGMAGYALGRILLARYAGLSSPTGRVGLAVLVDNFPFWHAGIWLALKGGWLLVGLAFYCLWQRREFVPVIAFAGTILPVMVSGFMVYDVLRSTSYVLPALLVALVIIKDHEKTSLLRLYCLAAFLISAVTGNYNVWLGQVTWFRPLAAKFLYYVFHTLTCAGPAAHPQ